MNKKIKNLVKEHAIKESPYECVGFVVSDALGNVSIEKCENIHRDKRNKFSVSVEGWQKAHEHQYVLAFYHSHCDDFIREKTKNFSTQDILMCNECDIPFLLYAHPNDSWSYIEPVDFEPIDLKNRPYIEGYWDCYTLIRDYYRINNNILLDYFFYPNDNNHIQVIESNIDSQVEKYFKEINLKNIQIGDLICFQILGSKKINHFGIYIDNNIFLHQLRQSFSQETLLDGKWIKKINKILRIND